MNSIFNKKSLNIGISQVSLGNFFSSVPSREQPRYIIEHGNSAQLIFNLVNPNSAGNQAAAFIAASRKTMFDTVMQTYCKEDWEKFLRGEVTEYMTTILINYFHLKEIQLEDSDMCMVASKKLLCRYSFFNQAEQTVPLFALPEFARRSRANWLPRDNGSANNTIAEEQILKILFWENWKWKKLFRNSSISYSNNYNLLSSLEEGGSYAFGRLKTGDRRHYFAAKKF